MGIYEPHLFWHSFYYHGNNDFFDGWIFWWKNEIWHDANIKVRDSSFTIEFFEWTIVFEVIFIDFLFDFIYI